MTVPIISCPFCIHFRSEVRDRNVCTAFPEGIPHQIAYGEHHHTVPWPDDNGTRFAPIEGFEHGEASLMAFDEAKLSHVGVPATRKASRQIPWARPMR